MTITTQRTKRAGFCAAALGSFILVPAATAHAFGGATYKLTGDAEYAKGCFPPCMCPILVDSQVTGTFRLTPVTITGTYDEYSVSDIEWFIPITEEQVSGSGTLTNFNEFASLQRLELDLVVGNQDPIHVDSHFVTPGADWPALDIAVSMHDMFCFDIAFWVRAAPINGDVNGDGLVNTPDLLSVIKSWGACAPDSSGCPADVAPVPDGDGVVNVSDLLAVIEGWGG